MRVTLILTVIKRLCYASRGRSLLREIRAKRSGQWNEYVKTIEENDDESLIIRSLDSDPLDLD